MPSDSDQPINAVPDPPVPAAEREPAQPVLEPTDLELAQQAGRGDRQAFHVLIDRHADRLFRLAVSMVGQVADAEDILQETLTGAFNGLGRFEGRASVKTWLSRILMMQVARWRRLRRWRARLNWDRPEAREHDDAGFRVDPSVSHVDRAADLQAALRQLSAEHREVVLLREYQQLSYDEIAAALGVPRGTVESRLFRARQQLRELLKEYAP